METSMELNESLLKRPNYVEKVCGILLNALFALIILVLIFSFFTTVTYNLCVIDGKSMNPTLTEGQYVLCEKSPRIEKIKRGDIIVFNQSETAQYIKRVVAVGGDTVEFKKNTDGTVALWVNGDPQDDSYLGEKMQASYWTNSVYSAKILYDLDTPFEVKTGCVFALGDNRNNSLDSRCREVGQVKAEQIVNRVHRIVPKGSIEEAYLSFIYGTPFKPTAGDI